VSDHREIEDMIDILTMAIVRQETEEQFFRRSAQASTSPIAKPLLLEIANDLRTYSNSLGVRRQRLLDSLDELKRNERARKGGT
jgi:hypothetical protein